MSEDTCDSGEVKVGLSARIAYMPQIIKFENNDLTVLETLYYFLESGEAKARNVLAGFHFKGENAFKKVGSLSGGEKSRLKLCLLMQNNVNFLILDEPTNHLDIESREWIEDAIYDFNGTILFISHDRYFLNKFADKVWSMENGEITEYTGGFGEYAERSKNPPVINKTNKVEKIDKKEKKFEPIKESSEIKRLEELEKSIADTEDKIKNIDIEMESDAINSDHEKLNLLYEERQGLENTLELMYNDWEILQAPFSNEVRG